MKTKLLVEGWKNYLNQENYHYENSIFLNKNEIDLIIETYDFNKNKINEGKFSDFFINIREEGSKFLQKIKKLKTFFKTPQFFKNFVDFLKHNKKEIVMAGMITVMGTNLIGCSISPHGSHNSGNSDNTVAAAAQTFDFNNPDSTVIHKPSGPVSQSQTYGLMGAAEKMILEEYKNNGPFKSKWDQSKNKLETGECIIIINERGEPEIVSLTESEGNDNDTESLKNHVGEKPFSGEIQEIKDRSIYGEFFINPELQKSLLDQIKNQVSDLDYGDDDISELKVNVSSGTFTTYIVKHPDKEKGLERSQAEKIINTLLSNFDSMEKEITNIINQIANEKYPNASSSAAKNIWEEWKSSYKDRITRCIDKFTDRDIDTGLGGFACRLTPFANKLNEIMQTRGKGKSLFASIAFDTGDRDSLVMSLRHEFSHTINDHQHQADILNSFNSKIKFKGNIKKKEITGDTLKKILKVSIEETEEKHSHDHEHEGIDLDDLIQELLNSGQIKKSNNKYIVYKVTDRYMSHYNEMRQHRIDNAVQFDNLQIQLDDKTKVKSIIKNIKKMFDVYINLSVASGSQDLADDIDNLKALFANSKVFYDYDIVKTVKRACKKSGFDSNKSINSEYQKLLNILEDINSLTGENEEVRESVVKIIQKLFQISMGHEDNPDALKNEVSVVSAIYDLISSDSISKEDIVPKALEISRINDLFNDKAQLNNLLDDLFSGDKVKEADAHLKIKTAKDHPETYQKFKSHYRKFMDEDFNYDEIIGESKKRFEDVLFERVYTRLLSESKNKYAGSHPDESYKEWHDFESNLFDKKGLTTSSKDRKTTKNYFKDMGLLEESEAVDILPAKEIPSGGLSVGLVPMSAKPFHDGHMFLIRKAAEECKEVIVYVSITSRSRKGEVTIYGEDMEFIWKSILERSIKEKYPNVSFEYGGSPVRNVYKKLEEGLFPENIDKLYGVYTGKDDAGRYKEKYYPEVANRVYIRAWQRGEDTMAISGTLMRSYLSNASEDKILFLDGLPREIAAADKEEIFNILFSRLN